MNIGTDEEIPDFGRDIQHLKIAFNKEYKTFQHVSRPPPLQKCLKAKLGVLMMQWQTLMN